MKIIKKEKIQPINVIPEGSISLEYNGEEILTQPIEREMVVDEIVVFNVEKGDFGDEVTDGIGGAFLETKQED